MYGRDQKRKGGNNVETITSKFLKCISEFFGLVYSRWTNTGKKI